MTIKEMQSVDLKKFEGNHRFLAGETAVPNLSKADTTRINMFDLHLPQAQIINEGQFPKVFSGFENQIGLYSSGYKRSDRDMEVIKKIVKNDYNYILITIDENNHVGLIEREPAVRLTESFGYKLINDYIDEKDEGHQIEKNDMLYHNPSYDKNHNMCFGRNFDVVYLAYKDLTHEDGIVIKESTARDTTVTTVTEVKIEINTNDVLVNQYGNSQLYKAFPDIGEPIVNSILASRRRINYQSAFFDLSTSNLAKTNFNSDSTYYADGIICDIEVFSNVDVETLRDFSYNEQIVKYLENNLRYYTEIVEFLEPYIKDKDFTYSDDIGYLYKRAKNVLDPNVTWKDDNSDFDNVVVRFKVVNEESLVVGSKITNRYGGKGVISKIIPDDEMIEREDGTKPDLIINPLGVINRLNPAQLIELELNSMSEIIEKRLRAIYDENEDSITDEMEELLFEYINAINPVQAKGVRKHYDDLDEDGFGEFWTEILFGQGILIHQPPFYGNVDIMQLFEVYDRFNIKLPKKFKGIEEELICGKMYYLVLKHHPKTKFSARPSQYTNSKDIPSKSMRFKNKLQPYQSTPIRLGEMEITNLFISKSVDDVLDMLNMYSINKEDRGIMNEVLLTEDPFNITKIETSNTLSRTSLILDTYLNSLGLSLVEENDEDTEI